MGLRDHVQAVIDGILKGEILATFDAWYDDAVIMSENGGEPRRGKAANRAYEEEFVANVDFHGADVGRIIVDEAASLAAVEWTFDFTPKGAARMIQRQVSVQQWAGDRIVAETFYYQIG